MLKLDLDHIIIEKPPTCKQLNTIALFVLKQLLSHMLSKKLCKLLRKYCFYIIFLKLWTEIKAGFFNDWDAQLAKAEHL